MLFILLSFLNLKYIQVVIGHEPAQTIQLTQIAKNGFLRMQPPCLLFGHPIGPVQRSYSHQQK